MHGTFISNTLYPHIPSHIPMPTLRLCGRSSRPRHEREHEAVQRMVANTPQEGSKLTRSSPMRMVESGLVFPMLSVGRAI